MITALLNVLGPAFELLGEKEKNKYIDEILKLKERYYEESKMERPDHSVMDNIELRLMRISEAFVTAANNRSKAKD